MLFLLLCCLRSLRTFRNIMKYLMKTEALKNIREFN